MSENVKVRRWMLFYTIIFGLLSAMFAYDNIENEYHVAYIIWSGIDYVIVFVGNMLYSLNQSNQLIRKLWKFIFPIIVLDFIAGGVIDSYFGKSASTMSPFAAVVIWIIGFALFFPSFRAHYLLGYKKLPSTPCT